MNHEYSKYIDDYMKGELKSELKSKLIEHSKNCSECSRKLNILNNIDELITDSLDDLHYKSRSKEIIHAAESLKGGSVKKFLYNSRRYFYGAAFSAIILAAVMIYNTALSPKGPSMVNPIPQQSDNASVPTKEYSGSSGQDTANSDKKVPYTPIDYRNVDKISITGLVSKTSAEIDTKKIIESINKIEKYQSEDITVYHSTPGPYWTIMIALKDKQNIIVYEDYDGKTKISNWYKSYIFDESIAQQILEENGLQVLYP